MTEVQPWTPGVFRMTFFDLSGRLGRPLKRRRIRQLHD